MKIKAEAKKSKKDKSEKKEKEKPAEKKAGFQFDASKDEVIKDYGTIKGSSTRAGDISVRVVAYNGGEPKLAIMRTGLNQADEPWFSPRLGRLSLEELNQLIPLIEKAQKKMTSASKE